MIHKHEHDNKAAELVDIIKALLFLMQIAQNGMFIVNRIIARIL